MKDLCFQLHFQIPKPTTAPSSAIRKEREREKKKQHFRGSFQLSIVNIRKKITPLETWNLIIKAFPKA